jgi:hypothetical protein
LLCSAYNVAGKPPHCIWNILMFSPSLFSETSAVSFRSSFTTTTMTSADFLAHRKRIYSKTSPGKSFFLRPITATSTIIQITFFGLYKGMLAYPCIIASYVVSVRQYRILQARFLQCILHSKPPCDLLMLRDATPAHKGLPPSGKKINYPTCCLFNKYL